MNKTPIDILLEKGYNDVIVFRNPDYTDALIALTPNNQAVYDYDMMVEWLVTETGMDEEEACDLILYNDSFYYGKDYPIVYFGSDFEEEMMQEDPEYKPLVFTRIKDLPYKTK